MLSKGIKTSELARMMGLAPQTIRTYVKNNTIPYHMTPGGRLYFTEEDVKTIMNDNQTNDNDDNNTQEKTWAYYVRSSSGNKSIKDSQIKQLNEKYPTPTYIIQDNASGLNENRKGLQKLYALAENKEITDIAITHKDRLTRFGYSYLEKFFNNNNITIHILNENSPNTPENKITPENELMNDFMALIASFSGRYYRIRGTENQKRLLEEAQKELKTRSKTEK